MINLAFYLSDGLRFLTLSASTFIINGQIPGEIVTLERMLFSVRLLGKVKSFANMQ